MDSYKKKLKIEHTKFKSLIPLHRKIKQGKNLLDLLIDSSFTFVCKPLTSK